MTGLSTAFHLHSRAAHSGAATIEANSVWSTCRAFLVQKGVKHTWTKVLGSFRRFCSSVGRAYPGHPSHLCTPHFPTWSVTSGDCSVALGYCCCSAPHSELGMAAPAEVPNSASGSFSHAKKLYRTDKIAQAHLFPPLFCCCQPLTPLSCPQTGDGRIRNACVLVYNQVFQLKPLKKVGLG